MANRKRAKDKLEKLLTDIREKSKTTGIAVENKVTIIQPKKFFVCKSNFVFFDIRTFFCLV
jgi:hypothetical protein